MPSLRGGRRGDKLGLVSIFYEERNKQHENRPIYTKLTNICTTSSLADPQMRRNLNARVPPAQGAFVRDGPCGNSAGVSK